MAAILSWPQCVNTPHTACLWADEGHFEFSQRKDTRDTKSNEFSWQQSSLLCQIWVSCIEINHGQAPSNFTCTHCVIMFITLHIYHANCYIDIFNKPWSLAGISVAPNILHSNVILAVLYAGRWFVMDPAMLLLLNLHHCIQSKTKESQACSHYNSNLFLTHCCLTQCSSLIGTTKPRAEHHQRILEFNKTWNFWCVSSIKLHSYQKWWL